MNSSYEALMGDKGSHPTVINQNEIGSTAAMASNENIKIVNWDKAINTKITKYEALIKECGNLINSYKQAFGDAEASSLKSLITKSMTDSNKMTNELIDLMRHSPSNIKVPYNLELIKTTKKSYETRMIENVSKLSVVSVDFSKAIKRSNFITSNQFDETITAHPKDDSGLLSRDSFATAMEEGLIEDIDRRDKEIDQLARDIVEINQIFRDLSFMVNDQTPLIDNIAFNVSSAVTHTEAAIPQLRGALKYQKLSREKMLCVGCICVAVLIVLVLIIALSLRK